MFPGYNGPCSVRRTQNTVRMDPDYCQNALPVYAMGGSAAAISMFFLAMSQAKAHKQSPSVYYHGFGLFLVISSAIMARQFYLGRRDPVEDIYNDILKNAKEIDRGEKNAISALISQALHGDVTYATESLSEQVLGWSRALAGFGTSQQTKMNAWAAMKGMPKGDAVDQLKNRACQIVGKLNKKNIVG